MFSKNMTKAEAQYVLALVALKRLSTGGELSLKDLFSPLGDEQLESPAMAKMGSAKGWQRGFLERCVAKDLVWKVSTNPQRFKAVDIERILEITQPGDEGLALKKLLWPSRFEDDDEPEDEEVESVENEVNEDEEQVVKNEEDDVITGLVDAVLHMTEHLKENTQHLKLVIEAQERIEARLTEIEEKNERRHSLVMQRVSEVIKRTTSKTVDLLVQAGSKLAESSARHKSLLGQIESQVRKDENLATEISEALKKLPEETNG